MAVRINADQQAIYIYEPAGHTVPAMNAAWTILGEVVVHSDVNLPSIIVTRYLDATPTGWAGTYYASDGSTHYIYNNPGTGQVASSPWTMGPGRYSYSLHYNGSNLIQVRVDGVLMLEFAATVPAGTDGARSVQWGGFGTPALAGYMDSTWQRWRMWTADLSPLECFAEFRSATPVRTSGLIHNWPMDAGSARLDDTVSGEPDLLDNPSFPCGDGTDIALQTGERVYFGAVGTSASGTASCAPAFPSGISASTSDLFLLVTGRSNDASTAFGVPGGWTLVSGSELEGGTGTWGADTGTRRVALYKKDTVAGSETGTISVTLGGAVTTNNTLRASIFRTERPSGTTLQVVATTGADTTNGTGFSATGSASLAFDVGDLVMVGVAQNIDTGTQSAVSLTASGIEFAPRQNIRSDAVTNGNDHRHILDAFHAMSGAATVAPVYAYTISAAGSGTASFVRMRAVAGSSPTQTTSLSMAVQLARSASASLAAAVQVPQQATTSVALAVAAARTATASVAAAIQQAQAATALVQAAIQAPQSAGTSVVTAIQAARTAAADLALAVQDAKSSGVGVDLQVQAPSQVSTAVSLQVQAGASASASVQVAVQAMAQASTMLAIAVSQDQTAGASLSSGVQVARTGSASAGLAIQAPRSAGVGVDMQIQEGSTRALALQAAVQFAASASTALSVAVAQLQTAGVGLAAAISLQNTLGFAVDVAVRAAASAGLGLSMYIETDDVPETYPLAGMTQGWPLAGLQQTFPLG